MRKFVRKLTFCRDRRRSFDRPTPVIHAVCTGIGVALALIGPVVATATTAWQPNEDILAVAESHLLERIGPSAHRTSVKAGSLDPRHRLPLCDRQLDAFLRRGTEITARTVVGVRCEGAKPWTIYVPVSVFVSTEVYTARQTLPRGHLLTEADLKIDERDVSRLVAGYMSNKEQLIGQRLKQPVIAGRIITPTMLEADLIIKRGQSVTLLAIIRGTKVRMSGKALINGALGQRIEVENSNSGRVVEGVVRSSEIVEVLLTE